MALKNVDWIGGHPNIQLPEPGFQLLLVATKEIAVLRFVFHIDENAEELITKTLSLLPPCALDHLGFPGNGSKPFLQFAESLADQVVRDRLPVIELPWQQELVTTQSAHR
jgi:hypothetical protein